MCSMCSSESSVQTICSSDISFASRFQKAQKEKVFEILSVNASLQLIDLN